MSDNTDWRSDVESPPTEVDAAFREVVRAGTEIGSGKCEVDCKSSMETSSVGDGAGAGAVPRVDEEA